MRCSASGSNRSASFVDSTRSQKRIVTIFRVSRSAGAARGAPQAAQKRASSPLAAPQRGQVAIGQVYGGRRAASRGGATTTARWIVEVVAGEPSIQKGATEPERLIRAV